MYHRRHAPSGPDPPRMSGTKRAAQSSPVRPSRGFHPSRMMPQSSLGQMPSFSRHGPANVFGPTHRKRTSYPFTQPLAPPQGQRPRQFTKRARQPFNDSSPISARRIVAASSAISAPLPVKSAQHNLPYWQVNDGASARATDSGRFPAMTAGNRSVPGSDYRDVTVKKFVYSNHDVRKEYDSTKDAPIFFGRKAARKVEEQTPPPDDDSTSDSSESDSDSDDDWESVSESDRDSELDKPDLEEDLSDDNIEIVDMRPFKPPVIELLDDTPPPSPVQTPRFLKPSEEIITAIEDLALSTECLQELRGLPFLKRNVRRGFFNYCRARGIPTDSDDRSISISVVFKLANTELFPHEASVSWFECPLCRLHRPFQTKDMLQTHLDLDHAEVETTWDEIDRVTGSTPPDVFNSCQSWRLVLLLGSSHDRHVSRSRSPTPGIEIILPETILDPIVPPPDPLGPTARYPFLPAKSEYGGSDVQYSVRFGGPKIYDLLGTLPMEKYGILGWAVLDKEEEIFESDDIPDEHKVMHALWGRWIFFNRNLFIAHYFHGAEKFVDDYWKMIRLAAGWNALRYWLVMLMATRFLTGRDVALLLKRYERWCAED